MQAKLVIASVRKHGLDQVMVVLVVDGRVVYRTVRWSELAARADVRRWAAKAA